VAVSVSEEQVLWFRARRGHLAGPGAADVTAAARTVLGAQAQQLPPALLALSLRTKGRPAAKEIESRLLEAPRTLVRTWGQRGTLHVYDPDDWSAVIAARRAWGTGGRGGPMPSAATLSKARKAMHAADRPVTRGDLISVPPASYVRALAERAQAANMDARRLAASRLFWCLAESGEACLAHNVGSERAYATRRHWFPDLGWPKATPSPEGSARDLARRYLAVHGPATATDIAHFFGARVASTRRWLAELDDELTAVTCGDRTGLVALTEDVRDLRKKPPTTAKDWPVRLLPLWECMLMAHGDKSWTMPDDDTRRRHVDADQAEPAPGDRGHAAVTLARAVARGRRSTRGPGGGGTPRPARRRGRSLGVGWPASRRGVAQVALRSMRLGTKLFLAFAALGTFAIAATGRLAYVSARTALEHATYERLTALREAKRREIEGYFREMRGVVSTLSVAPVVTETIGELTGALPADATTTADTIRPYYERDIAPHLGDRSGRVIDVDAILPRDAVARELQRRYIADNPEPIGRKDFLNDGGSGDAYDAAHALCHPLLHAIQRNFGFYDLFLVEPSSQRVVYSVFKEIDFGTSLADGPFAGSGLARAAAAALAPGGQRDEVFLVDFTAYPPSGYAPAAFISTRVFDDHRLLGALVVQVPVDRIDAVMTGNRSWQSEGLGASGETYLVGEDLRMRSDSRFIIEDPDTYFRQLAGYGTDSDSIDRMRRLDTTILLQPVNTDATRAAIAGERGTRVVADYRGVPVLSSFSPLDIPGVHWALLSEIDEEEAFAPTRALHLRMGLLAAAAAIAFGLLGWIFSRSITRPVTVLTREAGELGRGDLSRRVHVTARDEIGVLGRAFNQMADDLERTTVSKAFVDDVLASMSNALIVTRPCAANPDADTTIQSVNRAACAMTGRDEDDLAGARLGTVFPDIAGAGDHWLDRIGAGASVVGVETVMARPGGTFVPVLVTASVLHGARESSGGVVIVAQDITERKAAEAATRERDRMQHDLSIASRIQRGLLPHVAPSLPGYDVAGWSRPAESTGGDYFDWQQLPDGRLAITIADVTGHGIGPALVTAVCRAYARVGVASGAKLNGLMTRMNELLVEDLPADRFITFAMAHLDARQHRLELLSAGQAPWLLCTAEGVLSRDAHDVPFGVVDGLEYGHGDVFELTPGDMLVLVTDGFFEWTNEYGEQFGTRRLVETIRELNGRRGQEVIDGLVEAVELFVGDQPQPDDLTAVILRRCHDGEA
jgi:PAS domain S-box-containing protein